MAFGVADFAVNKDSSTDISKILNPEIYLVDLHELKEHEQTEPKYLNFLKERIKSDGLLKISIAVDKNTK